MKNGRIDELEQRLAAANAELKASHEQSAAQINIIAAKEKEFEVKERDCLPSCFQKLRGSDLFGKALTDKISIFSRSSLTQ